MGRLLAFVKQKKVWLPLMIVALIVGAVVYQRGKNSQVQYTTDTVKRQRLVQTVSATGTVEAAEEVNLNFKVVGRITRLNVKVGDQVRVSEQLAMLDTSDAVSALVTAEANLKSAQAAYDKLQAGAKSEDVAVYAAAVKTAESTLDNTRATQAQAVQNALAQLVGLQAQALSAPNNSSTATVAVSGTYVGTARGKYTLRIEDGSSPTYSVFGLETAFSNVGSRTTPTPLGSRGLRVQFSSAGTIVAGDTWTIEVPNTASSSYSTYEAAYQTALKQEAQQVAAAERALEEATVKLEQVRAPARSYDILSAEAAVASARGSLLQAQANLSDRTIVAPVSGIVTKVNNEPGETNSLAVPVVVLVSESNHEVKVQVPESDIAKLKVAQVTDMTLDAFGGNEHFTGHISFIDPASTVIADVVYYEVTVLFDTVDQRIKPGMTANVDVISDRRDNVLVVPLRAVKYDAERQAYVEVLGSDNQVTRHTVTIGLRGDDGLVELLQGLGEGEQVITFKQNGKK